VHCCKAKFIWRTEKWVGAYFKKNPVTLRVGTGSATNADIHLLNVKCVFESNGPFDERTLSSSSEQSYTINRA
jgi:hypothetical protein